MGYAKFPKASAAMSAAVAIFCLAGCSRTQLPGPEACADPKLLRIAIGGEVFDFPDNVDGILGIFGEEKEGAGVIRFKRAVADEGDRFDCNKKDQPIADFGDWFRFDYEGDVSKSGEWFSWKKGEDRQLRFGGRILKYEADHPALQHSDYIADVENIEDIEFVKRTPIPRVGTMPGAREDFEFRYQGKTLVLDCDVGIYEDQPNGGVVIDYSNGRCLTDPSFRFNDILIELIDPPVYQYIDSNSVEVPPEKWPQMWAHRVNTILDLRVPNAERAHQQ